MLRAFVQRQGNGVGKRKSPYDQHMRIGICAQAMGGHGVCAVWYGRGDWNGKIFPFEI